MKPYSLVLLIFFFVACTQQKTYQIGKITIPQGELLIWLYDETPEHKEAFIELASEGYWNDYTFNRVIDDFVAQGGCPDTPEGFAYSIHLLEPEFDQNARHVYGAFGAGRDDNEGKLSAACQFYIVQNKNGLARLDDNYTIYGLVFQGMDVIDRVVKVPTDSIDQPLTDIPLQVEVVQMTQFELEEAGLNLDLLPSDH
jgi:peptidyl-prolyl cis-trans isomerase B (cyclophilin B)